MNGTHTGVSGPPWADNAPTPSAGGVPVGRYVLADPTLRHQVSLYCTGKTIDISCNCMPVSNEKGLRKIHYLGSVLPGPDSVLEIWEIYNTAELHTLPFTKGDECGQRYKAIRARATQRAARQPQGLPARLPVAIPRQEQD